jgi:hypothetical protein
MENLKEVDNLEDKHRCEDNIKNILKEYDASVGTRFVWLRIVSSYWLL